MRHTLRHVAVVGTITLALSGCASFVAQTTGAAPLGTESGVRSFPQVLTDNSIESTAKVNMYKLDPRFKFARINVTSYHSVVLLTGQVPDEYLKQLAEDNLKAMSDVKAVHNYITVGDKIAYQTIMQDSLVTADIRRKLLSTAGIADNKVKVQTENGAVYVMGKLTPSETAVLYGILQNTPNIVKVVSLLDSLSENGVPTGNNALSSSSGGGSDVGSAAANGATNSSQTTTTGTGTAAPLDATPLAVDPEAAPAASSQSQSQSQPAQGQNP